MRNFYRHYLTFARFFLLLLVIGATFNLAMALYDTGYVTGASLLKPQGLLSLQLDRSRPYQGPIYDLALAARNGWQLKPWAQRYQRGAAYFTPEAVPATLNQAGFQLLTNRNYEVLRYVEGSARNRLFLLWLGASPTTMSVVRAGLLFGILFLLWLMVRELKPGSAFTPKNAARLRMIVLLALVWEWWQAIAHLLLPSVVPAFAQSGDVLTRYVVLNGDGATPGSLGLLVLFVVSFVYQHGVQLQQEVELTV